MSIISIDTKLYFLLFLSLHRKIQSLEKYQRDNLAKTQVGEYQFLFRINFVAAIPKHLRNKNSLFLDNRFHISPFQCNMFNELKMLILFLCTFQSEKEN